MDVADRACARQIEINADALADRARSQGPALSPQASALCCADCGDAIPEARRLRVAGCERCVECQEDLERGAR